jgi:RNA polymerase sigma-70 factor, ECF subfamily
MVFTAPASAASRVPASSPFDPVLAARPRAGLHTSAAARQRSEDARTEAAYDARLVQRFKGGDAGAFDEIVRRYHGRMLGIATQFLRNHADAEEIAQDTFVRAHRALAEFRGDSSLATWLHRIAINLARNRYWYFHRRQRHMALSLDCPLGTETSETFCDLVATPEADPARQASVDEFEVIVSVCMKGLTHRQREILGLRNLLHRSYEEIASALGTNAGTVKSRIARARGRLREIIADTYPEFPVEGTSSDWFEPVRGSARLH